MSLTTATALGNTPPAAAKSAVRIGLLIYTADTATERFFVSAT